MEVLYCGMAILGVLIYPAFIILQVLWDDKRDEHKKKAEQETSQISKCPKCGSIGAKYGSNILETMRESVTMQRPSISETTNYSGRPQSDEATTYYKKHKRERFLICNKCGYQYNHKVEWDKYNTLDES